MRSSNETNFIREKGQHSTNMEKKKIHHGLFNNNVFLNLLYIYF